MGHYEHEKGILSMLGGHHANWGIEEGIFTGELEAFLFLYRPLVSRADAGDHSTGLGVWGIWASRADTGIVTPWR